VSDRFVGVLAGGSGPQPPPGIEPEAYRLALLEDTYEVAAGLELVTPALILCPPEQPAAEELVWPGTEIVRAAEAPLSTAYAVFHRQGAGQAAIIAPDAPDLPGLLIGKLFRALATAPVAVCQADAGGLVALAVQLPLPDWLDAVLDDEITLDTQDAFARLRDRAPRAAQVRAGPGWHRLRTPADVSLLDPGLEGWESTRALLS
jgi:hypothetical protein